ncbi:Nn.00g102230.m01.CDS01 [Neocucurbitaria sp. VM-36]
MSANNIEEGGQPPEIIGYAEPWIVAPGDSVAIKISCTEPEYKYRTVRLIQGIDIEHSPKKVEEEVKEIPRGQRPGKYQTARPGSYGLVPNWAPPISAEGLQVSFYMQPWLLDCTHAQTLVSTQDLAAHTGFSITLNRQGSIDISVGTEHNVEVVSTGLKPREKTWSKVKLVISGTSVQMSLTHVAFRVEPIPPPETFEGQLDRKASITKAAPLFIASCQDNVAGNTTNVTKPLATDVFNGRIDRLTLKTCGQHPLVLAKYDFSLDISSDYIIDTSGRDLNGVLINAPTRAVKGHDWDGSESDWTRAKFGYGAIHFHDDDLDDAGWDTDFVITIPSGVRSGAYAVEVETTNGRDMDSITFFVRPTSWTSDNSMKVCLVFSTFTYLAYANERMYDTTRQNTAELGPSFDIDKALKSAEFYKMRRRVDLGLSCYDRHNDGSGVCFSSAKRPIMNVRPGYIMWGFSRPREFSADLMMLGFLEREGIPYEISTDHDLHARGASALQGFNTVITGSHPEYPTLESFNAYNAFAKGGGNLMYMGGNGFYWVSALDAARPHRLEVRRGDVGVRAYGLPGGEHVNSTDGQRGGLWRSRGMSCNTLFGVGFCAQGTGPGVPFKRTEASKDDRVSWMFTDVSGELFGTRGFGGGASGDEIDRYDVENGSPADALTLATSTGHSDDFGIAIEDLSYPALNTLGTQTNLIRSDVVYYVGSGGGGIFSVGSINWYCSLAWDNYENNVANLTGNVIRGFLAGKR